MPAQWTEHNTLRFLLYVVQATGVSPTQHFATIAEKMGPEFTISSLSNKWVRLKALAEKDRGLSTPAKGGKKASKKIDKAGQNEDDSNSADEMVTSTLKRKTSVAEPRQTAKKLKVGDGKGDAWIYVGNEVKPEPKDEYEV